jgi:hypothetical protein
MSSTQRGYAQPVTKTLSGSTNTTTYIHTQTQLENIMKSHGAYTQVGNLYTFDTLAGLLGFIGDYGSGPNAGTDCGTSATFVDMGKDLTVGLKGGENLLTFRNVRLTNGTARDGGNAITTGYTIVRNLMSHGNDNNSSYRVHVSRQ